MSYRDAKQIRDQIWRDAAEAGATISPESTLNGLSREMREVIGGLHEGHITAAEHYKAALKISVLAGAIAIKILQADQRGELAEPPGPVDLTPPGWER